VSGRRPSRRDFLGSGSALVAAAVCTAAGAAQAASQITQDVINSVFGPTGLPLVKSPAGFTLVQAQYGKEAVEFVAPSGWLVQRNSLPQSDEMNVQESSARVSTGTVERVPEGRKSPLTAGDYRKAEGVSFHALAGFQDQNVSDIRPNTVAKLVIPDISGKPEDAVYLGSTDKVIENGFKRVMDFRFETYTASGYSVVRLLRVAFTIQGGKLYALAGSANVSRFKKLQDSGAWEIIFDSFHVAII